MGMVTVDLQVRYIPVPLERRAEYQHAKSLLADMLLEILSEEEAERRGDGSAALVPDAAGRGAAMNMVAPDGVFVGFLPAPSD